MKVYNEELTQILTNYDLNVGYLAEKDFDNEHIYIYKQYTEQELKQRRIYEIQARLNQLSQDFVQADLGAVFDDLEARKSEFKTLHNELRELQGKDKRKYI